MNLCYLGFARQFDQVIISELGATLFFSTSDIDTPTLKPPTSDTSLTKSTSDTLDSDTVRH